ncbi:hypothetical protein U1Q18_027497 [Sarracenia purpurea var. burkii]
MHKGRSASNVSKSVGGLDLSAKEKSGKPPRRLSIPANSPGNSATNSVGNITPISEARSTRASSGRAKVDTPVSNVSKSSNLRKFCVLSSASYWLSQIKLSESASKHSISLGFFKLALEAGCEPHQRMRDELKSYAQRHNLSELGEPVKELFESYNILDQLQVSETISQVPEEGTQSSDYDAHSSTSVTRTRKLIPKPLNTSDATVQASSVKESAKGTAQKDNPRMRARGSWNKNSSDTRSASETAGRNTTKKTQKPSKQESNKDKDKMKGEGERAAYEQGNPPCG